MQPGRDIKGPGGQKIQVKYPANTARDTGMNEHHIIFQDGVDSCPPYAFSACIRYWVGDWPVAVLKTRLK